MNPDAGHTGGRLMQGQLAWRCRRGMKELDLLLEGWLRRHWERANGDERARFALFLELPDPEMAALLLGGEPPGNPDFDPLLRQLRADGAGMAG